MKRLLVMCLALLMMGSTLVSAAPPTIEAELSIITPVAAFVSTAALDAFRDWAGQVRRMKTNYMSKGTQVAAGMVREWVQPAGRHHLGGETVLCDELAADGFNVHEVPQELMDKVPDTISKPRPMLPIDPKGFWTGTALEPWSRVTTACLSGVCVATPPTTWEDLPSDPKFKGSDERT